MKERRAPVSFAQQRLWLMEQMQPGTALFNLHTALRIVVPFDRAVLERTLNEIVRRHGSLRTTFAADEAEQVVQVIAPALHVPLPLTDLTGSPHSDREAEAVRLATEEARRPFDLERGPLLRTRLLRLDAEEHILLLTMHHIISDAWSMGIFWKELRAVWTAFAAGADAPLPELTVQYADYAVQQREQLQGDLSGRQLAYWKKQLAGLPVLELPFSRPRPAVQTFQGCRTRFEISPHLAAALRTIGRREGATLFMTLFSAFAALLSRTAGRSDIVTGTYIAGRNHSDFEPLIGFFLNTLVLRVDLSGDPPFPELLKRVRDVTLDAYANQDVPFAKLVEELQPERDLSRNPLFQVLFQMLNVPTLEEIAAGPKPNVLDVERGTSTFDITCTLQETSRGLAGELEYNADLFEAGAVEDFARRFVRLLGSIARNPAQRLSELSPATPLERYAVLTEWNRTEVPYDERSLAALFDAAAKRHPDSVALISGEEELRYGELRKRAGRLAAYLRSAGIAREAVVGICLERSPECVAALLAVVKAGAAFLPLDPAYPPERLRFMATHSRAALILTRSELRGLLPETGVRVICLDQEQEAISACKGSEPREQASPSDLAYVIYTSGSTGTPKGVAVEHRQILNRLAWMWEEYPFARGEVCCHKTGLSFVDSLWEIFGPLLQGVAAVIVPDRVVRDPYALVQMLAAHGVTRLWLVPSLLRAILQTYPDLQQRLPRLRFWVSSGEELSADLLEHFESAMPDAVLFNLYGTSEVWDATWYDPRTRRDRLARVPIGTPIWNVRAYVLDAYLDAVPPGAPGDLYIAGDGLARGYLHDPIQTAEKFIPDPYSLEPGARLYRTGDLARWTSEGSLELLGRADHQVKVRGYRVELTEIEAALRRHEAVEQAAVALREIDGEKTLCAWLTAREARAGLDVELRRFLRSHLPEYAVPSRFLVMSSLPLTPSGKIDRRALPSAAAPEQPASPFGARANEAELAVLEIWREVLGRKEIGLHDNFFDLGGHSLLMMRAFNALRSRFRSPFTIIDLFQYPTVSTLAGFLGREPQAASPSFAKIRDRARRQRQVLSLGHAG
jgi:amino acid adenylation domain-containing protein